MGKVILVKSNDEFPMLVPAIAEQYDGTTQTVTLNKAVQCGEGEPVDVVPVERCFEFDASLMNDVNALTQSALNNQVAAQMLCDSGLLQVQFMIDGVADKLVAH